jgi:hypothetical protein
MCRAYRILARAEPERLIEGRFPDLQPDGRLPDPQHRHRLGGDSSCEHPARETTAPITLVEGRLHRHRSNQTVATSAKPSSDKELPGNRTVRC